MCRDTAQQLLCGSAAGKDFFEMEQNSASKIVTLKDLWEVFVHRLWIILLAAVVAGGGFLAVDRISFTPQYASTATLYILRQADSATASDASSDFSLALKVVNDCTYLLKSHTVLDEVIGRLHLDVSYEDLYDCVSTSNPEDTRILEVTVRSDSPENAKRIVDQVCTIGAQRIEDAMGFQQVNLYEFGTTDPEPCNRTGLTTFLLAAIAAALAAYIVLLVIFLMDDRIKTDEDIQQMLGLSVLASIPCADGKRRGNTATTGPMAPRSAGPIKRRSGGKGEVNKTVLKLPGADDFFTQEAFKTLRTNLQFCGQDIRTVVITSCNENEGKTTVTLQLGKSLAELGKRVLVIDADMRKSVMAGRNTTAASPAGLSEVLTGQRAMADCLYETQYKTWS